jgi:beta-glucanase (GH16 family)
VVTAFITMSDVKDEIDWEFPGATTTEGQSNFFWQGVIPTGKNNGGTHGSLSDTFSNYHDYTVNWQPDSLTWSIDGTVVRTIQKSQTIVNGVANYPTTPSRVQLSLWPAGIPGSAPGTVDWSGGMINWQDPDYVSAGHFYALVNSVTIKCADPQTVTANTTSYVFSGNRSDTSPTILYTNHSTMVNGALGKFEAAGINIGGLLVALGMGVVLSVNALLL